MAEERSILAYFSTPDQAERALERLKTLQLVDSRIERFDGMPGEGVQQVMNPITGNFGSLGGLTLAGGLQSTGSGILAATNVSASGYSSGGPDNRVSGRDILLTAIVEEQDFEQAQQIVEEYGAL